jgi:RsiW-degrading membrane proteinase PrsW (M82 family)
MGDASAEPNRPARYGLALIIAAAVVAGLVASMLLSAVLSRSFTGHGVLLGLPAVALVAIGTYVVSRAIRAGSPAQRRRRLLHASALLVVGFVLWLVAADVYLYARSAGAGPAALSALACVPSTAFGLWVVRRLDRNVKDPWRLVLVAAAWGGIVATALAYGFEAVWGVVSFRELIPGPGLELSMAFSAGLFEELGAGVAVLLLFLVMREEFDDIVDGVVYGAAVGLGFNYIESIEYMTSLYGTYGFAGAASQWVARQGLGLFFGHATFTALTGAGLGVARQTRSRPLQVLLVASGWLAAIAGHFAYDSLQMTGLSSSPLAAWPYTLAVLVLLALGVRTEGRALRGELAAEAREHPDVIGVSEAAVLTSPLRRFLARARSLRGGPAGYLRRSRLQAAQLELGMLRWHRTRQELDAPLSSEEEMRERVRQLRQRA